MFHKRSVKEQIDRIAVLDLKTRQQRVLVEDDIAPKDVSSGHQAFARWHDAHSDTFRRRATNGDGQRRCRSGRDSTSQAISLHRHLTMRFLRWHMLIYVPEPTSGPSAVTPMWIDRKGRESGPAVSAPISDLAIVQLSPDGKRLLALSGASSDNDIWLYNLGRPSGYSASRQGDQRRCHLECGWFPCGVHIQSRRPICVLLDSC